MSRALKQEALLPRIDGISRDIEKLRVYAQLPFVTFASPSEEYVALTQFYLRQALEGVFHIGEHILSRIEGGRATDYKDIARKLKDARIVPQEFADTKLIKMAGYRNRLTHFYAEVSAQELYDIIKEDLDDFGIFLDAVKHVLEQPEAFGLMVE